MKNKPTTPAPKRAEADPIAPPPTPPPQTLPPLPAQFAPPEAIASTPLETIELPARMTPAIASALSLMVFHTGPIARTLRKKGHQIDESAEAEQAFVLWWALRLAIKHGEAWKTFASEEIKT
jgi:hypothetical protein